MNKLTLLIIAFTLCLTGLNAQDRKIKMNGTLTFKKHRPYEAKISVYNKSSNQVLTSTQTSSDGTYHLEFISNQVEPKAYMYVEFTRYNKKKTKHHSFNQSIDISNKIDGQTGVTIKYNLYATKKSVTHI